MENQVKLNGKDVSLASPLLSTILSSLLLQFVKSNATKIKVKSHGLHGIDARSGFSIGQNAIGESTGDESQEIDAVDDISTQKSDTQHFIESQFVFSQSQRECLQEGLEESDSGQMIGKGIEKDGEEYRNKKVETISSLL